LVAILTVPFVGFALSVVGVVLAFVGSQSTAWRGAAIAVCVGGFVVAFVLQGSSFGGDEGSAMAGIPAATIPWSSSSERKGKLQRRVLAFVICATAVGALAVGTVQALDASSAPFNPAQRAEVIKELREQGSTPAQAEQAVRDIERDPERAEKARNGYLTGGGGQQGANP
jgi:hypothetical protein